MKELLEIIPEKTTDTAGAKVCSLGEAWAGAGGPAAGFSASDDAVALDGSLISDLQFPPTESDTPPTA